MATTPYCIYCSSQAMFIIGCFSNKLSSTLMRSCCPVVCLSCYLVLVVLLSVCLVIFLLLSCCLFVLLSCFCCPVVCLSCYLVLVVLLSVCLIILFQLSCCLFVLLSCSCCPVVCLTCCLFVLLSCCLFVLLSCCLFVLLSCCCPVVCLSCCPVVCLSCCLVVLFVYVSVDRYARQHKPTALDLPLNTSGLTQAKLPRWSVRYSLSRTRCLLRAKLVRVTARVLDKQEEED